MENKQATSKICFMFCGLPEIGHVVHLVLILILCHCGDRGAVEVTMCLSSSRKVAFAKAQKTVGADPQDGASTVDGPAKSDRITS